MHLIIGVTILLSLTIFLNTVSSIIPITSDSPLVGKNFKLLLDLVSESIYSYVRNILQLHHVHGGEQCGHHHHGPELPPQAQGDPHHALLGPDAVPSISSMVADDASTRKEDNEEDNNDSEEDEGAGQDRDLLQISACQCA